MLPDDPPAWVRVLGVPFVEQYRALPKSKAAFDQECERIEDENSDTGADHHVTSWTGVWDDEPDPPPELIPWPWETELWIAIDALWASRSCRDPIAAAIDRFGNEDPNAPDKWCAMIEYVAATLDQHSDRIRTAIGDSCSTMWEVDIAAGGDQSAEADPTERTPTSRSFPKGASRAAVDSADVVIAIRRVASSIGSDGMLRDEFIGTVAKELGYKRTPKNVAKTIGGALRAASQRGIIYSERGQVFADCRTIDEYPRDLLKKAVARSIGRTWTTRDDAITAAARHLGFARTGRKITAALRSTITSLIRGGDLERDGEWMRRGR